MLDKKMYKRLFKIGLIVLENFLVQAYDLYRAGFQAIDIGHMDLEYEWYRQKTGGRCEVKHKYNNECDGGDNVEDIHDAKYEAEIVADLSK